jgi:hypothetical protein
MHSVAERRSSMDLQVKPQVSLANPSPKPALPGLFHAGDKTCAQALDGAVGDVGIAHFSA